MRKYVVYTRVSTDEQGKSGLGLEAQRRDIELFCHGYSEVPWEIINWYEEVSSGADDTRPVLAEAMADARKNGAELLVAKLDRLSRKVSFLANLLDDKRLKLRVASMPAADKFQLHIYAALAEQEREFISARTKAALAAAKARGVKLGGDRSGAIQAANDRRFAAADQHAARVAPIIERLRRGDDGMTLSAIADQLTALKVATASGTGNWTATAVKRVLERADAASARIGQEAERSKFAALAARAQGRAA